MIDNDPFRIRKGVYDQADLEIDMLADRREKRIPMELHEPSDVDDSFANAMDMLFPDEDVLEGKVRKSSLAEDFKFY